MGIETSPRPQHILPRLYSFAEAAAFIRDARNYFVVLHLNPKPQDVTVAKVSPETVADILARAERENVSQIALGFSVDGITIYIGQ